MISREKAPNAGRCRSRVSSRVLGPGLFLLGGRLQAMPYCVPLRPLWDWLLPSCLFPFRPPHSALPARCHSSRVGRVRRCLIHRVPRLIICKFRLVVCRNVDEEKKIVIDELIDRKNIMDKRSLDLEIQENQLADLPFAQLGRDRPLIFLTETGSAHQFENHLLKPPLSTSKFGCFVDATATDAACACGPSMSSLPVHSSHLGFPVVSGVPGFIQPHHASWYIVFGNVWIVTPHRHDLMF